MDRNDALMFMGGALAMSILSLDYSPELLVAASAATLVITFAICLRRAIREDRANRAQVRLSDWMDLETDIAERCAANPAYGWFMYAANIVAHYTEEET